MNSESLKKVSTKVASINEKRKAHDHSDYYPVSKKVTKIREWDLPKFEKNMFALKFEDKERNNRTQETNKKVIDLPELPLPKPVLKSIDDLYNKTKCKPMIYWTSNGIESVVTNVIESLIKSIENSNENNGKINKPKSINISNLFHQHEIIKMNCLDDGTLLIVYKDIDNNNKLICSIFDNYFNKTIKSTIIPIESSESNINLIKFNKMIYLTINKPGLVYVLDNNLTIKEEIKLNNISRLLGLNNSFIYYKPELENSKLESRINVYDRKLQTRKVLGQCNSNARPFYFSKTLVQLENYDKKYFCLDIDDSFKIMDEKSGLILDSIKVDNLKQFLITSNNKIVLCSKQYLTFIKLNGQLSKKTKLNDQLKNEICSFFNDCHGNIYLFDKHVLYVY